jgi:hypothetical protein
MNTPLRFLWIPKAVAYDGKLTDSAFVPLGVNKGTAKAIRDWLDTLGITESGEITPFGSYLFDPDSGVDPYLEHPDTIWLLFWQLIKPDSVAKVWRLTFAQYPGGQFEPDQLVRWLEQIAAHHGLKRTAIKREVDVLFRSFVPSEPSSRQQLEDVDCPFAELGLLRQWGDDYHFTDVTSRTLSKNLFVYMLLDLWDSHYATARSLRFHDAFRGLTGLRLAENDLFERLEQLPDWSGLQFSQTAKEWLLLRRKDVRAGDVLEHCYGQPFVPPPVIEQVPLWV